MKREPVILDTTIRDGSYAVHFQYTDDDVRKIVGESTTRAFPTSRLGMASPSAPSRRKAKRPSRTKSIFAPGVPWCGKQSSPP